MKFFWKYIFPGIFGLLIYSTVRIVNDTMSSGFRFWERPFYITAIEVVTTILVAYIFDFLIRRLESKFDSDFKNDFSTKKIIKELSLLTFFTIIIINLTILPMVALTDDGLTLSDFVQINLLPTLFVQIYFLVRRGNFYLHEFIASRVKLQKLENERLKTELSFLKSQFSPHFLFNGLNNIYFQMDKSIPEAKTSIEKLSELLRYNLYQEQQKLVPISKESKFIHLYGQVHKSRRSKDLDVKENLSTSEKEIYPHLLIPLVENAFKYVGGTTPEISMILEEKEGKVSFEIENTIRQVNQNRSNGIGLKNLKRRLEILYPNQHKFSTFIDDKSFKAHLEIRI
ncbi:sensor histidine kinase [Flexithrix dorotheae]|uniref:sensor histidine kinase n=1 Tax=Flexithrix dorotheae TaxID=70993 RepID=UPI00037F4F04|nr:histidine kinase [Flexithrix dorotheae]